MQDGNMRTNDHWMFTKYDVLGRPVITGIMHVNDIYSQNSDMQDDIDFYYSQVNIDYVTRAANNAIISQKKG